MRTLGSLFSTMRAQKAVINKIFCSMVSCLALSNAASAYSCTGPVSGVSIDNTGTIWASSIAGLPWLGICNVLVSRNNFDPAVCKAIHAQLLTAQTTRTYLKIDFCGTPSFCRSMNMRISREILIFLFGKTWLRS